MCGFGVQTQKFLDANKSIYPVGCADKAVMWIESHLLLVGALALGLALPQVSPSLHTSPRPTLLHLTLSMCCAFLKCILTVVLWLVFT